MGNGCRIFSGKCQCGYGCKSEYRYPNLETCNSVLNGIFFSIFHDLFFVRLF